MDLSTLTDVELTYKWTEEIGKYPESRHRIAAIDAEANARGKERMSAAIRTVNRERDPAAYVQEEQS